MSALQALDTLLTGLLSGWTMQHGRWVDDEEKALRYVVIKPAGGPAAELVRRPQFVVTLIGGASDPLPSISDAADRVVEAMRASSGGLVSLQAGEPAYMATSDGRPIYEIAVSAITV